MENSNSVPFVPNLMMKYVITDIKKSTTTPTQPPLLPPSKDGKDNTRLRQR